MSKFSYSQENNAINRQPVKLLKKKSYPTYQLYAQVHNSRIDPRVALKIAILETMSWLRKRFRDLEIPNEIMFPEADEYNSVNEDDFKSFRVDEGYIVDVVYLKESGIWSFHLVEPDLGPDPGKENQNRKPVPGRVFETNIAYIINNNGLECGFKTICSEPITTNESCEVFRLAVVKSLVRNKLLGLKQVYPIIEEPHLIESMDNLRRLRDFIKDKDRQLPLVIIAQYLPQMDLTKIEKNLLHRSFDYRSALIDSLYKEDIGNLEKGALMPIEMTDIIKYKMSFAQFVILPISRIQQYNEIVDNNHTISQGDIRIIYPVLLENNSQLFKYDNIERDKSNFKIRLETLLQEYPKGKAINYGNVKFLSEARIQEQQRIIEISNTKEEIIRASEEKLLNIGQHYKEEINKLNLIIDDKDRKISRIHEDIQLSKFNDKLYEEQIEELHNSHSIEINRLIKEIERRDQLLERPLLVEKVPDWVDKHFQDKLIFHQRAKDLICRVKSDIDMSLLCDALEYLACEYRDETLGLIDKHELNNLSAKKYNRPFSVTPSGDKSIEAYSKDYKIKYGLGATGKLKEVALDTHLKVGKGNENIIRIYFHIDREKKLIVVGSLPEHLKTSGDK